MSFVADTRRRATPTFPLTSMLDVMFLLLVFFMTISQARDEERQIQVTLPNATTGDPLSSVTPLNVELRQDGSILLNRSPHTRESLQATLADLARRYPNEMVYIRSDAQVPTGDLVRVFDIIRVAGFASISMPVVPYEPQAP